MMWNALIHSYSIVCSFWRGSARCRHVAHTRDQLLDMRNRRLRQYAMTEIENKRSGRKCRQNPIDRAVERFPSREERQGIEIALNRSELLDLFARKLRLNHPIEPNGIHRNSFDIGQELGAGAAGEADDFCIRNLFSNRVSNPSARRDTPFAEFIGRQYSGPGIE